MQLAGLKCQPVFSNVLRLLEFPLYFSIFGEEHLQINRVRSQLFEMCQVHIKVLINTS